MENIKAPSVAAILADANENASVRFFESTGADEKASAVYLAVVGHALRNYMHGSDGEQWSGKGNASRPLRGFWKLAVEQVPNKSGKLTLRAGPKFRALRDVIKLVRSLPAMGQRDKSETGALMFAAQVDACISAHYAPRPAKVMDAAAQARRKLDNAIRAVQDAASVLTGDDVAALAAVIATAQAMMDAASASKPAKAAKPASASKPAKAATPEPVAA